MRIRVFNLLAELEVIYPQIASRRSTELDTYAFNVFSITFCIGEFTCASNPLAWCGEFLFINTSIRCILTYKLNFKSDI